MFYRHKHVTNSSSTSYILDDAIESMEDLVSHLLNTYDMIDSDKLHKLKNLTFTLTCALGKYEQKKETWYNEEYSDE